MFCVTTLTSSLSYKSMKHSSLSNSESNRISLAKWKTVDHRTCPSLHGATRPMGMQHKRQATEAGPSAAPFGYARSTEQAAMRSTSLTPSFLKESLSPKAPFGQKTSPSTDALAYRSAHQERPSSSSLKPWGPPWAVSGSTSSTSYQRMFMSTVQMFTGMT